MRNRDPDGQFTLFLLAILSALTALAIAMASTIARGDHP